MNGTDLCKRSCAEASETLLPKCMLVPRSARLRRTVLFGSLLFCPLSRYNTSGRPFAPSHHHHLELLEEQRNEAIRCFPKWRPQSSQAPQEKNQLITPPFNRQGEAQPHPFFSRTPHLPSAFRNAPPYSTY